MKSPRICVAGIDEKSESHVRPITPTSDPITRSLLADSGGPFQIGAVVDLGDVVPSPSPPESEDHRFSTAAAKRIRRLAPDEYLAVLHRVGGENLEGIFGPELERRGRKFAVERGRGSVSLGVLRLQRQPDLGIDDYGKLRLRLDDPEEPCSLSVTDLRFVEEDLKTLKSDVIEDVRRRMQRGVGVVVMLGLARAFRAIGDDRERHWLQINGICMEDRPLGDAP